MSKIESYDDMVANLRAGKCRVEFTKVNGDKRIMTCTLNDNHIPTANKPKGGSVEPAKPNKDVVRAYDVNAAAWRSFRVANVEEWFSSTRVVEREYDDDTFSNARRLGTWHALTSIITNDLEKLFLADKEGSEYDFYATCLQSSLKRVWEIRHYDATTEDITFNPNGD